MQLTKGAIGNLINRYKAVLKKCHLMNTFGSLAVAGMLVMGGAGMAVAADTTSTPAAKSQIVINKNSENKALTGTYEGYESQKGGVISVANGATGVTITNSSFTKNTATEYGGAIFNGGQISITGTTFDNNIANQVGGALSSTTTPTASTNISNSVFTNNHSVYDGGAIGNYSGLKLENCLFEGNTAQLAFDAEKGTWTTPVSDNTAVGGGAISLGAVSTSSVASISGTTFKNNTSGTNGGAIATRQAKDADNSAAKLDIAATFIGNKAQQGGAIYNSFYTDNGLSKGAGVTVTGTFSGNEATGKGGAIYNDGTLDKAGKKGGIMTITDATFDGNKADFGGAIFNTGTLTINGGSFEGNTADKAAGAIYNAADATLTVDGVTFANNSSAKAGAINSMAGKNNSTTTIKNSKFNNNSAVNGMGGALANSSNNDKENPNQVFSGKMTLTDTTFSGNTARNGGALWNGAQWTVDITGGSFDNNSAVTPAGSTYPAQGGAISNSGALNISGVTFSNNKTDGLGGAIFNTKTGGGAGSITFNGTNTFTNNTAAGKANDIYNAGTITVAGGTTTLNSGLILAENGTVKVTGGTLDMASGSTLDMGDGTLTIAGGTFVADAGLLIKNGATDGSYAANDANKVTDSSIVGTQGNLNLRWFDDDYTLGEYTSVKDALLKQGGGNAELTLLNARLNVEDGNTLVTGAALSGSTATLATGAKVVANNSTDVAGGGTNVPHTPENYVSVVYSTDASKLLKVSTIETNGNSITAKGLKVDGLPDGSKEVTLQVTSTGGNNSTLTLVGDSKADTGVIDKDGKALATKAEVKANNTLNMGLTGNTRDQGLTLTEADVTGTLNANGGVTGTTSEYAINALTMSDNSKVNVLNSTMQIGEFKATGGTMFVDPAYVKIDSVTSSTFGTQLLVGSGSTVNIGGMPEADMRQAMEKAGMSVGPNFTVGANQSVLVLGQGITLGATGRIVVDANVDAAGTIPGTTVATAHFGDGSLLVVNGTKINGNTAALTLNASSTAFTVQNGAKLLISGAQNGKTYKVIVNGNGTNAFNGSGYGDSAADGWKGGNLMASSDMVTLTSGDGMTFTAGVKDAKNVFPDLSEGMTNAVNKLYRDSLNNVDSDQMGVRFLSRATDNRFLGMDKNAAAESIESAARIAFAGAAPQMTRMASDAGTNAVVNRLGFANPADGAQAMDAEGKIVDRNTTGFALWIAPLWQSQHGWGLDAGNMDYGFNGNLGGVSLGADYTFENAIRAGITFNIGGGYAESSGGDLSSTDNRMNFWGLGAYAGWNYENFGVMADVSYTSTWNQLKQDLDSRLGMGNKLEADVQASAISAGLRAEYLLQTSAMDIIPHIGVRYMSLNTWGYDVDTHGGTVLEGDSLHQDIWTFPIGVTFSKDFALDSGWNFKPSLDFSVIPAAGDIKAKHDVHFTGLPGTYEVETQMMDYLTWQGGVGLELANDNMSIGVNYTLQAGQHTTGHGVFGSFRYEF